MADDQIVENEGDGGEDVQKKKGGRKRTKMHIVYDRLNKPPQPVHYNARGQPDGNNASELSNFIATLVKSHIPLAHDDWRQVNVTWKTEFMKTLKKFYVVDDELKDWVWGTAHKKWRDFKSDLREKHFKEEETYEDLLVCRDDRVTIEDWEWLIEFRRSEEFKKRSDQGKQNRSRQKVLHTAGSKSYACVASKMHQENGYAPRRDELFLRTHSRRKDGTPIDSDTTKIIVAIDTNPELLEKTIEQGDILTHVLGKEKNGYVQCVGMGPSPGRLGIPGGQKLKSTRLQMAEEETKEAWRANDVLREHVEEIREETKSKIDGLMEEIDLLKWMMAQTIAANNKTHNIAREPEGSVGESFAVEDYNDLDDEEERIQQEMRKAKEHFEKKQAEVELLQKKKYASKEAAIRKQTELLQKKKKEVELSQMKGVALNQNKEAALVQRMKDAEVHKKQQESMQKNKDAEMHKKQQETMQKKKDAEMHKKQHETMQKEAAVTQKNHQQGKEVIMYNIYRDHSTLVAKATILSTDRKKMVGGRELGVNAVKLSLTT